MRPSRSQIALGDDLAHIFGVEKDDIRYNPRNGEYAITMTEKIG
jgi:hypothetical protein